ncbi:MAG: 50S ribosomal protein L9 [Bacteroidota bacterium]
MNVILLTDLDKLGEKYDVVTVKPGYGRNFLIPKRMAIIANATNLSKLEDYKQKEAEKTAKLVDEFKAVKAKIEAQALKIAAKAGTSGKIFGSVTNVQVAQALAEQVGVEVDRKTIEMPEEIKELGTYTAVVKLHKEVSANAQLEVFAD